ncbi:hypothetical protein MMC10_005018 [Thelotrema lepadinum]|nr:hypothetical protein [Thelotrema lepadinum]
MDPFVQQLANHTTRTTLVNSTQATIPKAFNYSSLLDAGEKGYGNSPTYTMTAAIQEGMAAHLSGGPSILSYSCPSDYCDYGSFTSLAICSQCIEVTSSPNYTEVTPYPYWDSPTASTPNWTAVAFGDASIANDDQASSNTSIPYAIFNFSLSIDLVDVTDPSFIVIDTVNMTDLGSISKWPNSTFRSEKCKLSLCLQKIRSNVRNGSINEVVEKISTQNLTLVPTGPGPQDFLFTFIDPDQPEVLYGVAQNVMEALQNYFLNTLWARNSFSIENSEDQYARVLGVWLDRLDSPNGIIKTFDIASSELYHFRNKSQIFSDIATAMTQEMRRHADGAPVAIGLTNFTETIILVRWSWLSLPAAVTLLGGVFVLYTAWISSKYRVPLWKEDVLAVMSHGFDNGPHLQSLSKLTSNVDLDDKAKRIHAYLQEKDDGRVILKAADDESHPLANLDELIFRKRRQHDKDTAVNVASQTGYELLDDDTPLQRLSFRDEATPSLEGTSYEGPFTPISPPDNH